MPLMFNKMFILCLFTTTPCILIPLPLLLQFFFPIQSVSIIGYGMWYKILLILRLFCCITILSLLFRLYYYHPYQLFHAHTNKHNDTLAILCLPYVLINNEYRFYYPSIHPCMSILLQHHCIIIWKSSFLFIAASLQ